MSGRARVEPSVAAGYARALVELAIAKGANREALLQRSGIDAADLDDQDRRIPFARYVALMRAGQALSGDPALALHFGEAFGIDAPSIVGLIGQASATLADAFAQLNRYSRLIADVEVETDGDRLVLSREDGRLWLVDTRHDPDAFPELTESAFARMARRSPDGARSLRRCTSLIRRRPIARRMSRCSGRRWCSRATATPC